MKLVFKGKTNDKDVWIKHIQFSLSNGSLVIVNRNVTRYVIDSDGSFSMTWQGCYISNGKKSDYSIKPADFKDAEIVSLTTTDYAPVKYDIRFTEWKACE